MLRDCIYNQHPLRNHMTQYISLFSGGGGLDLGLEAAGFENLLATDVDEHSCKTLTKAKEESTRRGKPFLQSSVILNEDINKLSGAALLQHVGLSRGQLPLLAGGPPCQAFSVFGKRKGLDDPRGQLAYKYIELVGEIAPDCFLFENVYGIMTIEKGAVFEDLMAQLSSPAEDLEYTLSVHRLNAVDFGVPQHRDRVFIIGCKKGRKVKEIPVTHRSPEDTRLDLPVYRNVGQALRGLPPAETGIIANHTGRKHSQRIIDRYASLKPRERDPKTRINKLDLYTPSYTIIVGSDSGGGKGHVHPTEPREVTPRESARIQTFPDWWAFSGTSRHPIRQIGNAVPPLLAAEIGKAILKDIFGEATFSTQEMIDILDLNHLYDDLDKCLQPDNQLSIAV